MTRWTKPEPQIVPAPYDLVCPCCGEDVGEDEPVALVRYPDGGRDKLMVCQTCACEYEPE